MMTPTPPSGTSTHLKMTFQRLSSIAFLFLLVLCTRCKSNELDSQNETEIVDPILADIQGRIYPSPDDEVEEDTSNRTKKALTPNKKTRIISMLFEGEDPNNLTTEDIILRLQEKYENRICWTFLSAVPDIENSFFLYDRSLLELTGDEAYMNEIKERREETFPHRFHLFNESCDPDEEKQFWRELFSIAENDTTRYLKEQLPHEYSGQQAAATPAPPPPPPAPGATTTTTQSTTPPPPTIPPVITDEDYVHIQNSSRVLMNQWHRVWLKYKHRNVCNPRLLLECLPEEKYDNKLGWTPVANNPEYRCQCRKTGIGLPTLQKPLKIGKRVRIQKDAYTTQVYYENNSLINSKEVRDFSTYKLGLECRLRVNLPSSHMDVQIVNPCDFFLPMIGECQAACVENASCVSVDAPEKVAAISRSEKDERLRIARFKLHDRYHNKCFCRKGKHCRRFGEENENRAKELRASWGMILIICMIIKTTLQLHFDGNYDN